MWNLKKLDVDDYRVHLDIAFPLIPPNSVVTRADIDKVLGYYRLYQEKNGRPCPELVGDDTTEALRQAVHDAYSLVQDRRRLGDLRAAIKLLAKQCPYCGFGPIEEVDHLLQRGQYKLFSIFPLNLVPSCGTCNRGKPKKPSEDPGKHQLHVYLEDLSAYEFLKVSADIDPVSGGLLATYSIAAPEGMPKDVYDRLVHHLSEDGFDLQTRYKKQVNIFLGEQEYSLTSTFESNGADGLRQWLLGTANAHKRRFGANDWRTALMLGLAACDAFCEGGFRTALGYQAAYKEQDDDSPESPVEYDDDEMDAIEAIKLREDAEAGRDFDPDADDWDEEDPLGSNVPA